MSEKQRVGVSEQLQEPWGGLGLTASSEGLGEAWGMEEAGEGCRETLSQGPPV